MKYFFKKYYLDFLWIGVAAIVILAAHFITAWNMGQRVSLVLLGIPTGMIGLSFLIYHIVLEIKMKIKKGRSQNTGY